MGIRGKSFINSLVILFSFLALGPLISIAISKLNIAQDRFFFDEPLPLALFLLVPSGLWLSMKFMLKFRNETWADIGLTRPDSWMKTLKLAIGLILADLLIIFALSPLMYNLFGFPHDLTSFEPLIGNFKGLIGILIFGWFMGGFVEETLFRGYLMTNLAKLFGQREIGWWGAALFTTLLFSLPHLYQGIGGAIQTGLLAFVSSAFFIKGGRNLLPLIFAHGILNSISFTSIFLGYGWA